MEYEKVLLVWELSKMVWQDIIFTVGSFIFAVALIPTIKSKNKPSVITSFVTFAVLVCFVACYISLEYYISAVSGSLTAICWLILYMQKVGGRK